MSDPREALLALVYAHEEAMVHGEIGCWACPDRVFEGHSDFAAHVAELIAREFLVVARSEITGTEYGYQHGPEMTVFRWTRYADELPRRIAEIRDTQHRAGIQPRAQALSRPVLAWSPVPAEDVPDGC